MFLKDEILVLGSASGEQALEIATAICFKIEKVGLVSSDAALLLSTYGNLVMKGNFTEGQASRLIIKNIAQLERSILAMNQAELVMVLRGIAAVRFEAFSLLREWDARAHSVLGSFRRFHIVSCIIAFGHLIWAADLPCLGSLWCEFAKNQPKESLPTLAQLAYSAAKLGTNSQKAIQHLSQAICASLSSCWRKEVSNLSGHRGIKLLWSCCVLGIPITQDMANRIFARLQKKDLTEEGMTALSQAAFLLGVSLPGSISKIVRSELLCSGKERIFPNSYEQQLYIEVSRLGANAQHQWPFHVCSGDIGVLDRSKKHAVVLEMNGVCHQLPNGEVVPRDSLKKEMARRYGIRIRDVSCTQWAEMTSNQRSQAVAQLLSYGTRR